jgi:hypothetical protein
VFLKVLYPVHMCMYTYIHTHMHTYTYLCMHHYVCIMHIIRGRIHTYIHMHIHCFQAVCLSGFLDNVYDLLYDENKKTNNAHKKPSWNSFSSEEQDKIIAICSFFTLMTTATYHPVQVIYICMYTFMHARVFVCIRSCVHIYCVHLCMHVCVYVCVF